MLFVSGDPHRLHDPQFAIVGSRHPTPVERNNARVWRTTGAGGVAVTSGLAAGIDSAAHEGALDAGGLSIAVFATRPERVYPARYRELAQRIASHGACISEFPTGVAPQPGHFPRRNHLISGLSLGVLVVEAARRTSSLITAGFAAAQGRKVFTMPATYNLIARGAIL
jgi:DNA processing protein